MRVRVRVTRPELNSIYEGRADGQFVGPCGVTVVDSCVYVTDMGNRVQVFNTDGSFVRVFGSRGSAVDSLSRLVRTACADGMYLYVVDNCINN